MSNTNDPSKHARLRALNQDVVAVTPRNQDTIASGAQQQATMGQQQPYGQQPQTGQYQAPPTGQYGQVPGAGQYQMPPGGMPGMMPPPSGGGKGLAVTALVLACLLLMVTGVGGWFLFDQASWLNKQFADQQASLNQVAEKLNALEKRFAAFEDGASKVSGDAAGVAQLNARLRKLATEVNSMGKTLDGMSGKLDTAASTAAANKKDIASIKNKIASVQALGGMKGQLDTLLRDVAVMQGDLAALQKKVGLVEADANFRTTTSAKIEKLNSDIRQLYRQLERMQ